MANYDATIVNFDASMWVESSAANSEYTPFENDKPVGTDNVLEVVKDTRNNLEALSQAAAIGAMPAWGYSVVEGTGSAEEPQYVYYKNGALWIRSELTWSSGNVTVAVWAHSSDSGSNWDTIQTQTVTYDSDGNVETVVWS